MSIEMSSFSFTFSEMLSINFSWTLGNSAWAHVSICPLTNHYHLSEQEGGPHGETETASKLPTQVSK